MDITRIRNFSIIAHIDHGKSTLADRLMEYTQTVTAREMQSQLLDGMDIERERGITIKAQAVRISYLARNGETYLLNLIDTPGHVDFSYEVSRSLAACEGALLIVDASQGIQAQTLANYYLSLEHDLEIIPVLNKIDLPHADVEKVSDQIEDILGIDRQDIILASAKNGIGTGDVLEAVVKRISCPPGDKDKPLKALVFDSFFDSFQGVVPYLKVVDGEIAPKSAITMMASGKSYDVTQTGFFSPQMKPIKKLSAGEVGFFTANIKNINEVRIGDTVTHKDNPAGEPFPGYKEAKQMVFAGLYPTDTDQYENLKTALEKLSLNDSSFSYEPETSLALGFGFRCGFLGLLHLEIIQERLEREFNLNLLTTAPTVIYKVTKIDGNEVELDNPSKFPSPQYIDKIEEPIIKATIILPDEFLGGLLGLLQEKRGIQRRFEYLDKKTAMVTYELPLNEIVVDFYDRLKSLSRGYASFDYEFSSMQEAKLVKMDILINGSPVDALSVIVPRDKAQYKGRRICEKLKEVIPRQMYEVVIQSAIGSKIQARESISAMRKNVTAKCYGGDVTRKRKLLEKQKAGKKRMKMVGKVELPQEAFMAVLKIDK
ncbi:MAG: translation elongation factor 4 [bacterium]